MLRRMPGVAEFSGAFGPAEAERLLWRAGFGPRSGEAAALSRLGLDGAVHALTHPGLEHFVGPKPRTEKGQPLAPYDAWGHDHVWWLDRMVRTSRPLVERMTLVWHDWFATSNAGVGSQRLMLNQNDLFRQHGLGSFHDLLLKVTSDPAMLLWLNGSGSEKKAPNENYGREMMELFTLGAGRGYGEADVRQQARALTGFVNDWKRGRGDVNFRFDPDRHDTGMKTIFRHRGTFNWKDSCRLCVTHPDHPSFFVTKLWGYFVAGQPDAATRRALEHLYVASDYDVRTVVAAILKHPSLYRGARIVKSPAVFNAGLLRRLGDGVTTTAYAWLGALAGQQLFYPPNVAGWDDTRWLDTATWRGRWDIAQTVLQHHALDPGKAQEAADAQALLKSALRFWNYPALGPKTTAALATFADGAIRDAGSAQWKRKQYPPMVLNGLRHLIALSPEFQAA
jgi:uncharacterized protein (DUF1800 family)